MSNKPNLDITYNGNGESTLVDGIVTKVIAALLFPLPLLTLLSFSLG